MLKGGLQAFALACLVSVAGCAHSPISDPDDPMEGFNRGVYAFNTTVDDYVLRPVTKGYTFITPEFAQTGVSNFFDNLLYPTVIVNDALQGKVVQHFSDVARFIFNSIVGIGGLVDAASMIGLEKHKEDFGQTLGYWGVGNGAYLVLPFFGPSTNRDLVGRLGDLATSIPTYLPWEASLPLTAVGVVDYRAQLLSADDLIKQQLDPYIFVRNAYLQRRQNLVYDGNPPRELPPPDEAPAKKKHKKKPKSAHMS